MMQAKLDDADFTDSQLDKINAVGAELKQADFSGAVVSNGQFSQANLTHSRWRGADLSASFLLQAVLTESDFHRAKLTRCIFIDVQAENADFSEVHGDRVQFSNVANLRYADLSKGVWRTCGFREVNLHQAKAVGSAFVECDFAHTRWPEGTMQQALFHRCLMMQSQLVDANCRDAFFYETNLTHANLQTVDFSHARFHATDTSECLSQNSITENLLSTPFPIKQSRQENANTANHIEVQDG
jgi:uncharacterized protein YjbI with pentapeptide repeats